MRPLQNHFPVLRHLTTHAGLCTPQYLQYSQVGVMDHAYAANCSCKILLALSCVECAPSKRSAAWQQHDTGNPATAGKYCTDWHCY